MSDQSPSSSPSRRKRGRPSKAELAARSPGGRGKVGRPKGDAAIINEYKTRMLASPKSEAVLAKVFEVALDDDHKHQAACMKMVMDRMLPLSHFEKDKKQGGLSGVTIKIEQADTVAIHSDEEQPEPDAIDADYEEIE